MTDAIYDLLGAVVKQAIDDYVSLSYKRPDDDFDTARKYIFSSSGLEEVLDAGGLNINVFDIRVLAVTNKRERMEKRGIKYDFGSTEQYYLDMADRLKKQKEEYNESMY